MIKFSSKTLMTILLYMVVTILSLPSWGMKGDRDDNDLKNPPLHLTHLPQEEQDSFDPKIILPTSFWKLIKNYYFPFLKSVEDYGRLPAIDSPSLPEENQSKSLSSEWFCQLPLEISEHILKCLYLPYNSPDLFTLGSLLRISKLTQALFKDIIKSLQIPLYFSCRDQKFAQILQCFSRLQSLKLNTYAVTSEGFRHIARLSHIQKLALSYGSINDEELRHFSSLHTLKSLNLKGQKRINQKGLEHLSHLTNLQKLRLDFCKEVNDLGLRYVSTLSRLKRLYLYECGKITSKGIKYLSTLSNIKILNLGACKLIDNKGLRHISSLSAIQSLDLSLCSLIDDDGLFHLRGLFNIQTLKLHGCKQINGKGFFYLTNLTRLQHLNLSHCRKIDNLGYLSSFTNLQHLNLEDANIRDEELQHLRMLSALISFNIRNTKISYTGLQEYILPYLTTLRILLISKDIGVEGYFACKKAYPHLSIENPFVHDFPPVAIWTGRGYIWR